MTATPSQVELDGTRYRLAVDAEQPYREWVESDIITATEIVGSSRPASQPRPDVRTWRIDDWSSGEGYKFLDTSSDHPSQRGFSTADVDITVAGQVVLPRTLVSTKSLGVTAAAGPFLAASGGTMWVAYDSSTLEQTVLDTWTSRTSGMNAQTIVGPVSGHMSGLYISGVRSGADGGVRRVTSSGSTQWTTESGRCPLAADNRVYYGQRGTTTSLLKRVGLDAAGTTGTTMTTFNGVGTTYSGAPVQSVAIGSRIYTLLVNDNEDPRLWVLENDVGREVCSFPGLKISGTVPNTQPMCAVDGIVFVAGYEYRPEGPYSARLDFYDGNARGTVFTLDGRVTSNGKYATSINYHFTACAPGRGSEVILGVYLDEVTDGPALMRYNMTTGAVSQFVTKVTGATAFTSVAYLDGVYYGANTTTIYRTQTSGSGTYASSTTIEEPIWDFDLPDTEKLLTEIEVQTETLASGTSVEVQVVLDGTTTVTTDSAAATMAHSSGTRTLFTVSGTSTERTFRYIQPKIVLKTSNTANTPILYSVTLRCIPIATKRRFFEFAVDCTDETAQDRRTGQQLSGRVIRTNLETLRDSTSNRVFTFTPLYKDNSSPMPSPTETQHSCIFAPGDANGVFVGTGQGEGVMRLRLMKV